MITPKLLKNEENARVIPFRPRAPHSWNGKSRLRVQTRSPVPDLSKYSGAPEEDDYRQRMLINVLAFLVLSLMVYCGIWIADNMSQRAKVQDCVLMDRTNCAPILVPRSTR